MPKYETRELPLRIIGNKAFLTLYDYKRCEGVRDFVDRFPDCFDAYEPASRGMYGWFFYPEGKPENNNNVG